MALFKAPIASIPNTNAALLNGKLESALNVANADTLDNKHYSDLQSEFATVDHTHTNYVNTSDYEDSDVLTKIKNVDGTGSGLDADTVDGSHASAFATTDHTHVGLTPAPTNTQTTFLRDDNTWATVSGGGGGVELGETETTAYRGDRGKTAYDHSQVAHAPSTAITSTGVTYENLNTNGDVGTSADQVANGAHTHDYSSVYATINHNHTVSDITDAATTFATIEHTHTNASTTASGFLPVLENTTTKYLRDDGTWQTVSSGISDSPQITSRTYGRCNGSWVTIMPVVHVLSASTTSPPTEPADGDMYLLPDNCTGDWEYMGSGAIVYYRLSDTTWHYYGES